MPAAADIEFGDGRHAKLVGRVFSATVTAFALLIAFVLMQDWIPRSNIYFEYIFLPGIVILAVLGLALVILARRARLQRGLKAALILTGISAIGMPACAVLHNLVYALMILWRGEGFWEQYQGGDEGFLFILALVVFPLVLVVSAVVSTVLFLRGRRGHGPGTQHDNSGLDG